MRGSYEPRRGLAGIISVESCIKVRFSFCISVLNSGDVSLKVIKVGTTNFLSDELLSDGVSLNLVFFR